MNANDFFNKLANTRPFLKMALEGFAGSGKTFTSAEIAIGLHKYINSLKPIVWYDTERALKALKPKFEESKIEVFTRESRSLTDLNKTIDYCVNGFAEILIIDSITHVWESFVDAYRQEKRRTFIQFQDWGILKPKWKKEFSDKLVQSNLHIIFTGRAGYEYESEINEVTQKKELIKSGIKMKVENETEYEPDLVVLMEKIKEMDGSTMSIKRQATIIKDRTNTIDSKIFVNPNFDNFNPAIQILLDGSVANTSKDEEKDTFKIYEEERDRKKNEKEILIEEIQGIFTQLFPGMSTNEKKAKVDLLEVTFKTRSWKQVELMYVDQLNSALESLKIKKENIMNLLKSSAELGNDIDWDKINEVMKI